MYDKIEPGTRVFHRIHQAYGTVLPQIYQDLCDNISTFVRFDEVIQSWNDRDLQVTTRLLDIVDNA